MFQSLISTADPFSASQKRAATAVPQAYRGEPSRDAFARAMADMGRNNLATTMDEYRQQYQKRAEQARSNDLLTQRGIGQGVYELGKSSKQMVRQQDLGFGRGQQQVQQSRELARKAAEQQLVNNAIGAVFGSNNAMHAAPMIGTAMAGGARPLAGWQGFSGGGGLLSLLMGGA